jgi:hypothetical protein
LGKGEQNVLSLVVAVIMMVYPVESARVRESVRVCGGIRLARKLQSMDIRMTYRNELYPIEDSCWEETRMQDA